MKKFIFLSVILFLFLLPAVILAQSGEPTLWESQEGFGAGEVKIAPAFGESETAPTDLRAVVINIAKYVLTCLALVLTAYFLYGGYLWMTSLGSQEKIETAKKTMFRGVVGAFIVMISYAIVTYTADCILDIMDPQSTVWTCR